MRRVVDALRRAGHAVWWDDDIAPGAPWEATIERELERADTVIVCWSAASVASENVRAEARRARAGERLIQVYLEPCEPPLFFGERQGVNLYLDPVPGDGPEMRRLLSQLGAPAAIPAAHANSAPPPPSPTRRRAMAVAGGTAIAVAAGGAGWWALRRRAPGSGSASVAVMPFANLSGDPAQAYFSDGLAEELRGALGQLPGLRVIARPAMRWRSKPALPRASRANSA